MKQTYLNRTASGQLTAAKGGITSLSWYESSGSASATFELYDGTDVSGQYMTRIIIAQGTSDIRFCDRRAFTFHGGLYLNIVSGACKVVTGVHLPDDFEEWLRLGTLS